VNRKAGFRVWTAVLFLSFISSVKGGEQFSAALNIGFNGVYQVMAHTPVRIMIRNDGRGVDGDIIFRLIENYSADETPVIKEYRKRVFIPEGSSTITVPVQINNYRPGCRIVIRTDDLTLYDATFDLKGFPSDSPLIVGISRNPSLDPLISFVSGENSFPLVYPHPEILPNVWTGLSGAGLLIFHRIPSVPLADDQMNAVLNWTAAGGKVLIIGGASYSQETQVLLNTLLPVRFKGFSELSGDIRVSNIVPPKEGNIFYHNGTIIGVRKNFGNGWITFLTFDPASAERSGGMRELWSKIFPEPVLTESSPRIPEPIIKDRIFTETGFTPRFIPTWPVIIILGAFTIMLITLMLFPAPIFWTRISGAAALTLAAGFAVFFLFKLSGAVDTRFTRTVTVSYGGSGDALVTERHVHHGSVGETRFSFQIDKDSVFLPYPDQSGALTLTADGASYYQDTLREPWNSRYYRSVGIAGERIEFDVTKKDGLYAVNLKEPEDLMLTEAVLFIHGEPYSMGVLKSGKEYAVDPLNQEHIRIPDPLKPYVEMFRMSDSWTELTSTYEYLIAGLIDTGKLIMIGGNVVPSS
jgi:hypothetical protein